MLMSTKDGAVEHQPLKIGVSTRFLDQPVDQAALRPSAIPPLDRPERAEVRRQVLPPRSGARHPKQRADTTPIVRPRPALALAAAGTQRQNPSPLIIAKFIPIQGILPKYRLGSSS
jgi:hypothetical protein